MQNYQYTRLTSITVFVLLLGSFVFFTHAKPGWNVNSRFALTLAWAETGSPRVDRYVTRPELNTQDLATFNNHLYSDKSIGTSLLGVPAAWAVRGAENLLDHTFPMPTRLWLVTCLSVGVMGALAGVLLMHLINNLRIRPQLDDAYSVIAPPPLPVALTAMAVILGSMLALYSTLFMSYAPATACLLACLLLTQKALRAERPAWWMLTAGLLGGLAVLCEYTYGAAVAAISLWLAWNLLTEKRPLRVTLPSLALFALGGMIGITPFLVYTHSIFGRFGVPYEYHVVPDFREGMSHGLMGATTPKASVLWLISFHPCRGLFFYSPLLLAGFAGLVAMLRRGSAHRSLAVLCLGCVVFYFLFNSAYYMWWGGWSFSPRHMAPAIPFLAVGLVPWLASRAGRLVIYTLGAVGVFFHTVVNATEPQLPDGGWVPALMQPDFEKYQYSAVFVTQTLRLVKDGQWEYNIGQALGLPGGWSLLCLVAWWTVGILTLRHLHALSREKQ